MNNEAFHSHTIFSNIEEHKKRFGKDGGVVRGGPSVLQSWPSEIALQTDRFTITLAHTGPHTHTHNLRDWGVLCDLKAHVAKRDMFWYENLHLEIG